LINDLANGVIQIEDDSEEEKKSKIKIYYDSFMSWF
jgi:hypothetical protein